MTRNLSRRVEVGIPILDKNILGTLKNTFSIQWKDKVKARDLNIEHLNRRTYAPSEENTQSRSQIALYEFYKTQFKNNK